MSGEVPHVASISNIVRIDVHNCSSSISMINQEKEASDKSEEACGGYQAVMLALRWGFRVENSEVWVQSLAASHYFRRHATLFGNS